MAIAYIRGKTRVKGVSNKEVYYVGDVEKDGYVYFGDSMAYRCPTPANQNVETQISLTNVEIWYTVRNCWIRANYFTDLSVYWFDPEDMYTKITDNRRRIGILETWRTNVVDPFITTITNWKNNVVDPFISDITNWRNNTVDPFITTITNWKDNTVDPFILAFTLWRNQTVDPFIIDFTQWRTDYVNPNIIDLIDKVTTIRTFLDIDNWITQLQQYGFNNLHLLMGNLAQRVHNYNGPHSPVSDVNQLLGAYVQRILDSETHITNMIADLQRVNQTLSGHETRIRTLERNSSEQDQLITALSNYVNTLADTVSAVSNLVNTLNSSFNVFLSDFANYQRDTANAINRLGHESLGEVSGYGYGNGGSLLTLWNAVAQIIGDVQTSASLPSRTIWTNWTDV